MTTQTLQTSKKQSMGISLKYIPLVTHQASMKYKNFIIGENLLEQ